MAILTLDTFSGRPNPTVTLSADAEAALRERIQGQAHADAVESVLGYRGLYIDTAHAENAKLASAASTSGARLYLPEHVLTPDLVTALIKGTEAEGGLGHTILASALRPAVERAVLAPGIAIPPLLLACQTAPPYEPAKWNANPITLHGNNCYNYACNLITNSFAQPGRATGHMYTSLTCASVDAGAVSDHLKNSTLVNQCPTQGHLVALVIWPGSDFHWYRKGHDGLWTHKPGGTPATNLDNSGHTITDPRTANRGPYTQFCGFLQVGPGAVSIR